MRFAVLWILLLASLQPLLIDTDYSELDDEFNTYSAESSGVEVISEQEPNDSNTTGQEAYPGDVVRGTVDMWDDKHDWFSVWLEPGQTLLLTLSHASGDGVSMSVWDEENTHRGSSNPAKTRDTIFLDEEETDVGGVYSVSINATMTEAGGGAYVLEIDAGYVVNWYSPEIGWNVASEVYDARGNNMYTSSLSSYQFAQASTTNLQTAPVWTTGDYWNFSVTMPTFFGITYEEYHQMEVTGVDTVAGKECYRVSIEGKATLTMSIMGMETKTIDEESGVACYAKDTLLLIHENITASNVIETSSDFMAMSTSGRSCTVDGEPDDDCDGVENWFDDCPGTTLGTEVDAFGCPVDDGGGNGGGNDDTDGDGIPDSNDACPNEPSNAQNDADSDGCPDDDGSGDGDGSGNGGGDGGDADADADGVIDADDTCPDTPFGESVDFLGCSDSQNGGGDGSGNGGGDGSGGGDFGGGGIDLGCIPNGADVNQKTVISSDLTYNEGMNQFNFPITEGKVWSESAVGQGTISLSVELGDCELFSEQLDGSGALPLNYQHIGQESFTIDQTTVSANGIQVFAGREGNNDWATPDFTILPSVPDNIARMGLPFAAWINVVGFNEFDSMVNISGSINSANAALLSVDQMLSIDELGVVVVDTMNLSSGEYELTITGTYNNMERPVVVPFTVDNDPDFEILTLDPWIVLPGGVEWVVPTPIFIEPVNGFGADVTVGVTVPNGVTAELDFARGSAPFMAVLTLTVPANLSGGDYTVVVTGTSGDTVRSDELTISISTLPEFSLDIENREQLITNGQMSISGVINAHNGLDLSLGGVLDVLVEPYNEALLESAVISWGTIDSNGDLPFTVTFSVDENIPRNEYTVQLNVVSLDGGIAHAASVAFVTESSTLDGTAEVAGQSSVSTGDTTQHDGTDTSAQNIPDDDNGDATNNGNEDNSDSDSKSSNTGLIVGGAVGVLAIAAVVGFIVARGRGGNQNGKDFSQQTWGGQAAMMPNQTGYQQPSVPVMQQQYAQPQQMNQQPVQPAVQQPMQPVGQQPTQSFQPVQPVAQAPTAPQPVAQAPTAPQPVAPMQPTTVADYTGLPPGGQYDQSTGHTIYIQADGVRWQMNADGSFNRLN